MVLGIVLILIGVFFLYQTIKHPIKDDYGAINLKGYAAGILFIVIGIFILFRMFPTQLDLI